MNTLRMLLREGDPVGREPELAPDDVQRLRRAVLASEEQARPRDWTALVAIAAGLGLFVALGMWAGRQTTQRRPMQQEPDRRDQIGAAVALDAARRQVQFATPGGTRIIWVFDSNFSVR